MLKSMRKSKNLLFLPHFCFPWGRPCGNHAKRCINEKTIQCLPNPSQHVPIYLQQFPNYLNRKCKKSPFSRTAAHIFVSTGDAPAIITQYVAWMERQFNACQTPCSMYLSIFNSFRVIPCLSQCVSPKIVILPHFCFPWRRPWGNHAKCYMDGNRIRCLQIVSHHVLIYLQQFPSYSNYKCKKSPFSPTAAHIPLETPLRLSRNMLHGWKDNSMLAKPLQHIPIYLQ